MNVYLYAFASKLGLMRREMFTCTLRENLFDAQTSIGIYGNKEEYFLLATKTNYMQSTVEAKVLICVENFLPWTVISRV